MKKLKIYINGKIIFIPATDEDVATIHIFDNNGEGYLYIDSFCKQNSNRSIWFDFVPIHAGNKIEVEVVEDDGTTKPKKVVEESNTVPVKSKLEVFRELESDLQKKGLL